MKKAAKIVALIVVMSLVCSDFTKITRAEELKQQIKNVITNAMV